MLIYIHKERMLDAVAERYPARHYVMVDDKLRILAAMKQVWGDRLTTIFPRQGHYALDPKNISAYPAADLTVERIGDLVNRDLPGLFGTERGPRTVSTPRGGCHEGVQDDGTGGAMCDDAMHPDDQRRLVEHPVRGV